MTIAYILVTGTYMLIGGAFYICFPLPKFCIEDVRDIRRAVVTKAPLRVQFLLTFGGRVGEQEALALLSKKGGRGL